MCYLRCRLPFFADSLFLFFLEKYSFIIELCSFFCRVLLFFVELCSFLVEFCSFFIQFCSLLTVIIIRVMVQIKTKSFVSKYLPSPPPRVNPVHAPASTIIYYFKIKISLRKWHIIMSFWSLKGTRTSLASARTR